MGLLRTSAALGIDHELLRNLIISADVSNVIEDFRGIPVTAGRSIFVLERNT